MSDTTTPPADYIAHQAKVAALRLLEAHAKVAESVALDVSQTWWLDPRDLGIGDHPGFLPGVPFVGQGLLNRQRRGEYIPAFLTEPQLAWYRRRIRAMVVNNEIALNAVNQRVSYALGTGLKYEVTGKKGGCPQWLIDDAQSIIDAFVEHNELGLREAELLSRVDIDGEAFLRLFPGKNGLLTLRFVEPEHVTSHQAMEDNDNFGIRTAPGDVETVLGYWVVDGDPENNVPYLVDPDRILHVKHPETPSTSKRGLSAFYPIETTLRAAEDLLTSTVTLAKARAKIAWVHKMAGTTYDLAQQLVQNNVEYTATDPQTGSSINMERWRPGTIVRTGMNDTIDMPAANIAAGEHVQIMQMVLRIIASRFSMPEYMLTSDASNANYSASLVAESPFVKCMTRLQDFLIRVLGKNRFPGPRQSLVWRQLFHAIKVGLLPPDLFKWVEVNVDGPKLTVRDAQKEAQVNQTYNAMGVKSKKTIQLEQGLDPDIEKANFGEESAAATAPGGFLGVPDAPEQGVSEVCVPNRWGGGHHDDYTGKPCKPGANTPDHEGGDSGNVDLPGGRKAHNPQSNLKTLGKAGDPEDTQKARKSPGANVWADGMATQKAALPNEDAATKGTWDAFDPIAQRLLMQLRKLLSGSDHLTPMQQQQAYRACEMVILRMTTAMLQRLEANLHEPSYFAADEGQLNLYLTQKVTPGSVPARKLEQVARPAVSYYHRAGSAHVAFGPADPAAYAHVLTHAMDGVSLELSGSPAWQEAYINELSQGHLTLHATLNPAEGFAEFGRLMLTGDLSGAQVGLLYPQCYGYWVQAGLVPAPVSEATGAEQPAASGPIEDDPSPGEFLEEVFAGKVELDGCGHVDCYFADGLAEGEKKDKLGRRYCWDDQTGKRVPCPKKEEPEKKKKGGGGGGGGKSGRAKRGSPEVGPHEAFRLIKQTMEGGPVTPEQVAAVGDYLMTLTVKNLHALKGLLGLKASGKKQELASKIASRALEQARNPQPTPEPPVEPTVEPQPQPAPEPAVEPQPTPPAQGEDDIIIPAVRHGADDKLASLLMARDLDGEAGDKGYELYKQYLQKALDARTTDELFSLFDEFEKELDGLLDGGA